METLIEGQIIEGVDPPELEVGFYAFRLKDLLQTRNFLQSDEAIFADFEELPIKRGSIGTRLNVIPGLMYGINHGITYSYKWLQRHGYREYALSIIDCYNHTDIYQSHD